MSTRSSDLAKALGLAFLALASVAALERGAAAQREWRGYPPPLARELPDGLTRTSLLAALAGQARPAAAWAYIDCLQYLGDPVNQADGNHRRTLELYREVLWLDPGFRHAGREGVSALGWFLNRPGEAADLIATAMAWDPGETRYPAYLAALAYQEKLDSAGVVEALREEAKRPDAPEMLLRMLGNLYLKEKDWEGARTYWTWLQERSRDPQTLSQARRALAQIEQELRKGGVGGR